MATAELGNEEEEAAENIPDDQKPNENIPNVFDAWNHLSFADLPHWMKDNEHLILWHRPPLPSFRLCLSSMFKIHGETVNIWSHLIGAMIFLGLWMSHLFSAKPSPEKTSFAPFFASAVLCMSFSAFLHITCCHSQVVADYSQMLDYMGIGALIVGSFVPYIFYSFYCNLRLVFVYLVSVLIMGTTSVVISLIYKGPMYRGLRSTVFVASGLAGVVPAIHILLTEGVWRSLDDLCIGWLTWVAAYYIGGAVIYATRVPERFAPGRFDLLFNSHQLWHFAVLAGVITEYIGVSRMATYRHNCEKIGTCHCDI